MAGRPTSADKFTLLALYILTSACFTVHGTHEFLGRCGLNIDLTMGVMYHSGILTMGLPDTMSRYQDPSRPIPCEIILSFPSGTQLQIELYFLDIMPKTGDMKSCSTGLEISDQAGRKYYGSRLCMEGWQWEERHNQKQQEKQLVMNSPLTLRLISSAPYRGTGFKMHFNLIRPGWPCFIQEYRCREIQRCVHDDLMCDGWNDCGDFSDERIEAGCDILSASEICSIIMGIIILIGSAVEIVIFVSNYKSLSQAYGLRAESKLQIVHGYDNMNPAFVVGQHVGSQDSFPGSKSRRRQEPESGIPDVDKADRYNKKALDEMSEQSSYSNPRRNRGRSQGTDAPLESKARSGNDNNSRKGYRSSQSSLNPKRVDPLSGADNPALENDDGQLRSQSKSRDRHSRERDGRNGNDPRHSSDSDSNGDRDRYKGRRRSQERKRDNRYSDEDSEYERGRENSRRRRRRSYDTYSDDSEYERDRRKRSRERRSRERYGDSDNERDRRRSRDRQSRERYGDSDKYKSREQGDEEEQRNRRDSRERSPYDEESSFQQRKRSGDRRYSPSADRDRYTHSKNGKSRSWALDQQPERYRDSPPLPLPPPYSEEDTISIGERNQKLPPPEKDETLADQTNTTSPPASENVDLPEQEPRQEPGKAIDDNNWPRDNNERRERYSRNRRTSQKEYQNSPPPKYKDIGPKAVHSGTTYREESV